MLFARFSHFAFADAIATGNQCLILFLLVHWAWSDPVLDSSIGFAVSALMNYFLNYHYDFHSSLRHGSVEIKFMVLASVGMIMNSIIMQALTMDG